MDSSLLGPCLVEKKRYQQVAQFKSISEKFQYPISIW